MNDYLELLNKYDEGEGHLHEPADTSILSGLEKDIKSLQETLRTLLGLECYIHIAYYTDCAAWYGGLYIYEDAHGNPCSDGYHSTHSGSALNIRVSNFGRLTTIFGCTEEALRTYPVEQIREYITEPSFRYVPIEVLLTPYDGTHIVGLKQMRWFDRFFFYPN